VVTNKDDAVDANEVVKVAEKNSARFAKANADRVAKMADVARMESEIASKEGILSGLQAEIIDLEARRAAKKKAADKSYSDRVIENNKDQDAYTRAKENGGIDPKTGATAEELRSKIEKQSAELEAENNAAIVGEADAPHYSEQILAELKESYGWAAEEGSKSLKKIYGGGVKGGELNPSGSREFFATFDERARYLTLQHGFKDIFDIDCRDRNPKEVAKEFNDKADAYAAETAERSAGDADALSTQEQLRKRASMEKNFFYKWINDQGITDEQVQAMLDANYSQTTLFSAISANLPYRESLFNAIENSKGLTRYYFADASAVKALSKEDFITLAAQRGAILGDKSPQYGYLVLRNSNKKSDLDYVRQIGGAKNDARLRSQAVGGKLYEMAKPYFYQLSLNEAQGGGEPIELTGKELGDFPDTPEGKKSLRKAAKMALDKIKGTVVPCPALNTGVEVRKRGIEKIISQSADTRKLQICASITDLITAGKKIGERPPYDGDTDKSAVKYYTLRSVIRLKGDVFAVRIVIKEDNNGVFHYDHSVHEPEAVLDSAKENGLPNGSPRSATTSNDGGTHPSRLASCQLGSSVSASKNFVNTLDSAGSGMVFNLFIEGEEPEVVTDEDSDEQPLADERDKDGYSTSAEGQKMKAMVNLKKLSPFLSGAQRKVLSNILLTHHLSMIQTPLKTASQQCFRQTIAQCFQTINTA